MSKRVQSAKSPSSAPEPATASGEEYSFARFWRCALQVNPSKYQGMYRGQDHGHDEEGYNHALLEKCLELQISVVGVADHGSVESVDKLREVLSAKGIVVFPGFEIASTEKIHMVCLFSERTPTDQLNRYLGNLDLTDVEDGARPSRLGCLELAKRIYDHGGFWYAAHATNGNGLLRLNKDGGGLAHIWKNSQYVRVAQIPGPVTSLPENYRSIIENKNPDYRRERPIVVINAKDIAEPDDLENPSASTWIKMTRPSLDALKIAFLDPESRIRLSLADKPHSVLESMRICGGYLDGVEVRFSEHLNALIGGRGTGKSTLIECLRYVLELSPKGKQALKLHQEMLKENLGKHAGSIELTIRSSTQHDHRFTISRRYGEPPIVRDAEGAVSQQAPRDLLPQIEVYGQNEIFELAQDGQSRSRLLERFLPADSMGSEQREALRKKLADNAQKLVKASIDLDEVTEKVARLPRLGEQLKGFRDLVIEAKLAKIPLYARERQLVERIRREVNGLEEGLRTFGESVPDLTFLNDKALEGLPDASPLIAIRGELEQLRNEFIGHQSALQEAIRAGKAALDAPLAAWQSAMRSGEQELEKALVGLPSMAGKSGREVGEAYRRLTQEIEHIKPLEAKKSALTQLMGSLEQERKGIIAELSDLRRARVSNLQTAVTKLNQRLKGKLRVDLRIEGDRSRLKEFLVGCKLEGVGERRLAWIEEREITPLALTHAIREGAAKLASEYGITPMTADALVKLPHSKLLELEAIELPDDVGIELNVARGEDEVEQYKDLARLSIGQQCTAVLHLLLLDNSDPLVVDQPEDNLDNAFIAERIVRELRDAKTRRQFFFSTHNANIPVFGDAEWIGVLAANENCGVLDHQGSIDVSPIREQAAEILEGGRAAFMRRKEMYEF